MNCESCASPLTAIIGQQHLHCQSCNQFSFPAEIHLAEDSLKPSGKATEFHCPKCACAMELGLLRDMVDVCFCPHCRGFVIDNETLGPLIQNLRLAYRGPDDQPLALDPRELDVRQACPACCEPMEAHPYYGPGNSVIETCIHCKLVWFDHNELARIVRAPGLRR